MSGCEPNPRQDAARRGYPDAGFDTHSALEAYDATLEPFDVMEEATLVFPNANLVWTTVVSWTMGGGQYGVLRYLGQDCNDPTAYQRVSWRLRRNSGAIGGDKSNLIPALEARCGILDGTMMPYRIFIPPGGTVTLEAMLIAASGGAQEQAETVRGRLQGERRDSYGVRS